MAKKDVSAIVSGMGLGMSIVQSLMEKARKRGLSDDDIHRLATPEGDAVLDQFVEIMVKIAQVAPYTVTVDYERSLLEMITAGRYDWVNDNITVKHFPVSGQGKNDVGIQLVHFNCPMESDQAIHEMNKLGLRSARLEELLAFGCKYPEIQRQFPIVALGSVWWDPDGRRYVASLWSDSGGRDLSLYWFEGGWIGSCRFAAVRK